MEKIFRKRTEILARKIEGRMTHLPVLRAYSELSSYMQCSQMWAYRFAFGLEVPFPPDSPAARGIAIDAQVARLARGEPVSDEDHFINRIALRTWVDWKASTTMELTHVAPEFKGEFHGQEIIIHPDGIVEDAEGGEWVWDLKTHLKMPPPDPACDPQFALYAHVLKQNGINTKGYIVPRSLQRLPALPKQNKSKPYRVQKPKACGLTDEATYLIAIQLAGHHPSAYKEELEQVRQMRFFRLDKTQWLPGYVDAVIAEMKIPFRAMLRDRKCAERGALINVYRHLRVGFAGCERCRYRELCHDEMVMGPQPGLREALKEQWAREGAPEPDEVSEDILG